LVILSRFKQPDVEASDRSSSDKARWDGGLAVDVTTVDSLQPTLSRFHRVGAFPKQVKAFAFDGVECAI
jgi:hypothetical protein